MRFSKIAHRPTQVHIFEIWWLPPQKWMFYLSDMGWWYGGQSPKWSSTRIVDLQQTHSKPNLLSETSTCLISQPDNARSEFIRELKIYNHRGEEGYHQSSWRTLLKVRSRTKGCRFKSKMKLISLTFYYTLAIILCHLIQDDVGEGELLEFMIDSSRLKVRIESVHSAFKVRWS